MQVGCTKTENNSEALCKKKEAHLVSYYLRTSHRHNLLNCKGDFTSSQSFLFYIHFRVLWVLRDRPHPSSIIIIAEDCWVKRVFRTSSRLHPGVPSGCVFHFRLSSLPPLKREVPLFIDVLVVCYRFCLVLNLSQAFMSGLVPTAVWSESHVLLGCQPFTC